jgi:hypothetical protein
MEKKKGKLGGARPGAGMPKGKVTKKVLERQRVEKAYKQKILNKADQILNAQLALALGSYELFLVEMYEDDNGKRKRRHVQVTDPKLMQAILDDPGMVQGDNYVYVKTVEADKFTLDSLIDRVFGKATQSIDQTVTTITPQDVLKQLRNGTTPK